MKRISFFGIILCAMLLIGVAVQAANQGEVVIQKIDGYYNTDTLAAGENIRFVLRYNNNTIDTAHFCPDGVTPNPNFGVGDKVNISNGWRVTTPDGAEWDSVTLDTLPPNAMGGDGWDINQFFTKLFDKAQGGIFTSALPTHVDTVGWLGAGTPDKYIPPIKLSTKQVPRNFNDTVVAVKVWFTGKGSATKHICLDSAFWGVGGTWVWVGGQLSSFTPEFLNGAGPETHTAGSGYCFVLYDVPNLFPLVVNTGYSGPCSGTPFVDPNLSASHCATFTYNFDACQPDEFIDAVTFSSTGVGAIDAGSGIWSANTLAVGTYTVTVKAHESGKTVNMTVTATNDAPVISGGCGTVVITNTGATKTVQMAGTDADACDPKNWSVVVVTDSATGLPVTDPLIAAAVINGTGLVTFSAGTAGTYFVTVGLSDGIITAPVTCDLKFNVAAGSLYGVRIEKTHGTLQGMFEKVDVILESINTDAVLGGLGGFDILIGYDNSALALQSVDIATSGLYNTCKWEYFTYRFGADGNCGNACPSGVVRVVGLAETNNGAAHPICDPKYVPTLPTVMFSMNFLVSNDRTLECQYVPIRFFWIDCGDNTLSNWDGSQLYIAGRVFDYHNQDVQIDPLLASFPGYAGVPTGFCAQDPRYPDKPGPDRNIDFFNGGIDIVCADSIDLRGDINLNNVAYEIADAVMFTNYFVKGYVAFGTHVQGSIAASDVNADGLALSVADLVYLIRVIVGDALPYPKTAPVQATYVNNNGTLSVDVAMGAAYVVIKGEVAPELLAQNMEMSYGVREGNTHVIVFPSYNTTSTASFVGNFLNVKGEILSVEMATADGAPVVAKMVPANFGLAQNYPNPFNPTAVISFSLPTASQYTLTVYNVTGQKVAEFSGAKEAGVHSITFNGENMASGVYFYKLNAGNFSATKKMVLLK